VGVDGCSGFMFGMVVNTGEDIDMNIELAQCGVLKTWYCVF
jgi:hypothetical protein